MVESFPFIEHGEEGKDIILLLRELQLRNFHLFVVSHLLSHQFVSD